MLTPDIKKLDNLKYNMKSYALCGPYDINFISYFMYMCSFIDSLENLNIHTYTYTHKQGFGAMLSLLFCVFKSFHLSIFSA